MNTELIDKHFPPMSKKRRELRNKWNAENRQLTTCWQQYLLQNAEQQENILIKP
jgi:hypothetical protein